MIGLGERPPAADHIDRVHAQGDTVREDRPPQLGRIPGQDRRPIGVAGLKRLPSEALANVGRVVREMDAPGKRLAEELFIGRCSTHQNSASDGIGRAIASA